MDPKPTLPTPITIVTAAICLDGGTVNLFLRDGSGDAHDLSLIQHAVLTSTQAPLPGRLYLDKELVEIRSPLEQNVLDALRTADSGQDDLSELATTICAFVDSDRYLQVAEQVERFRSDHAWAVDKLQGRQPGKTFRVLARDDGANSVTAARLLYRALGAPLVTTKRSLDTVEPTRPLDLEADSPEAAVRLCVELEDTGFRVVPIAGAG